MALLTAVTLGACNRPAGTPADAPQRIDAVFADYARADRPGCVVGVAERGRQVFAKAYGLASVESGQPLTTRSTLNIGSISKQFTAFAALLLADRGQLDLDVDLRRHLPELPDYGTPIRVRDLLQHTTGLRDIGMLERLAGRRTTTMSEALDLAARQRGLNHRPGTTHAYSHIDYVLLAHVIERVTGEALGAFLDREVFGPLGMSSTRLFDARRLPAPGRALSHTAAGDGYRVGFPVSEIVGGNNLYTSVEDFLKWEANFFTFAVGGRAVVERLLEQPRLPNGDVIPYANGLRPGQYRGLRTIVRGASGGYASEMVRFPDQGLAVITMCNTVPAQPYDLGVAVAEVFLGDRMTPVSSPVTDVVPTPAVELSRYVGLYRPVEFSWNLVAIDARDGELYERWPEAPARLGRRHDGTFVSGGLVYTFLSDAGRPGLTLTLSGDGPPPWTEAFVKMDEASRWRPGSDDLAEYSGAYVSDDVGAVWRLAQAGDSLVVRRYGRPDVPLEPVERDLFARIWVNDDFGTFGLQFRRDGGGRIGGFDVTTAPDEDFVANLRFERR